MSFLSLATYRSGAEDALREVYHNDKINKKMIDILQALMAQASQGLTTRLVAEQCDMSVYSARNWLLKLEELSLVHKSSDTRNALWFWGTKEEDDSL